MSNTAPATTEKLLPADKVAEALNLSLSAVYRLVRSGDLPSHRFGKGKIRPRGVRVPTSAVEAYLNDSLIAPPATEVA